MDSLSIYDPYAFTYRQMNECATARAVADYVPVRSLRDGKWFAVYLPSNRSHRLSDVQENERSLLEREVRATELAEALVQACAHVREAQLPLTGRPVNKVVENVGAYEYARAWAVARKEGYTPDEIAESMQYVDDTSGLDHLFDRLFEHLQVVDVRVLAEGA